MDSKIDSEVGYLSPEIFNGIYIYGCLILRLIGTVLGVAAFGISARMIDFDVNKVISIFYKKSEAEIKLERLAADLKERKHELSLMSEMDEFANYHKKRRVILTLQDDYDKLAMTCKTTKLSNTVKISILSRTIIAIFAFIFSYISRDIIVAKIDEKRFWPLNFLLYFPWVFTEHENAEVPVTLFNFLVLLSITNRAYLAEKAYKAQEYLKKRA